MTMEYMLNYMFEIQGTVSEGGPKNPIWTLVRHPLKKLYNDFDVFLGQKVPNQKRVFKHLVCPNIHRKRAG